MYIEYIMNTMNDELCFPITFSIPESKCISLEDLLLLQKTKRTSNLIPGSHETYIYNTEEVYYNEYRESYFAITKKKGGWDCLRHYEIIANGCIPYFENIEQCPQDTMVLLPKELILQGNQLYHKNQAIDDLEFIQEWNEIIRKQLCFLQEHLSCKKMSEYILQKTNHPLTSRILYLSGNTTPDYLRCLTLIGFKQLLGIHCHDSPKIPHIYQETPNHYHQLYGKGMTYTNIIDKELRNDALDETIEQDLRDKKYDVIIYGSFHRGTPYYDLISSIYAPNQLIFMCGEEGHHCDCRKWTSKGHYAFVREPHS